MFYIKKLQLGNFLKITNKTLRKSIFYTSVYNNPKQETFHLDGEEFRVLVIPGHTKVPERKKIPRKARMAVAPPKYKSMPIDQDWTSVWPAARSFVWSMVPFPVRQGFVEKSENDGIVPGKYGNAELMKIPNFLHLTPLHIKKHCAEIKKYFTKWPKSLSTDEECKKHFPMEVITRDYVFDGSSIRDLRARVVTVTLKLSDLQLDYHARDKFIRLAKSYYNKHTDYISLEIDRCPMKKQNYDFAIYVLTVLFKESWKTEAWEKDKSLEDMEKYFWELNKSKSNVVKLIANIKTNRTKKNDKNQKNLNVLEELPDDPNESDILQLTEVKNYKTSLENILNETENLKTVEEYKNSAKKLLML